MASKTITTIEDDIDGTEATETVQFALDGTTYEIDLSEKHASELRESLDSFVQHARPVNGVRQNRGRRTPSSSPVDIKAVRAWAASNGVEVSSRGRVPASVVEQYRQAGH